MNSEAGAVHSQTHSFHIQSIISSFMSSFKTKTGLPGF